MNSNGVILNMVRKVKDILCIPYNHIYHNSNGISNNATKCWKWDTTSLISSKLTTKYAVIILNRPVTVSQIFMKNFWNKASLRMTVDGGTFRWKLFVDQLPEDARNFMKPPDLVTGDFDSVDENTLQAYKLKGCKIVETPDQNYTDFTKALMELNKHCTENNLQIDDVVAVCQNSGRIDHVLGNIQTLFLAKEKSILGDSTNLYIVSDDCLSWILQPGEHVIAVPEETRTHKAAWCSLIPIGQECERITTSGLKWNMTESLKNNSMKFGHLVSTSNAFDGSESVKVNCSHPVLWSMCIPTLMSNKEDH